MFSVRVQVIIVCHTHNIRTTSSGRLPLLLHHTAVANASHCTTGTTKVRHQKAVPEKRTGMFSVRLHVIIVRLPQNTHTSSSGRLPSSLHRTAVANTSRYTARTTKIQHRTHSARCSGKTHGNVFCASTCDRSKSSTEHPYHIIWKVAIAVTSYGSRECQSLYWREQRKYDIVHVQHVIAEKRTGMFSVRLHVITVCHSQNIRTTSFGRLPSPLHRTAAANTSLATSGSMEVRHRTHSASCSGKTDGNVFCTSTNDHSTSSTEDPYHIIWKVAVAVTSYGSRERQSLYHWDYESTTSYTFRKLFWKNGLECFLYVYM